MLYVAIFQIIRTDDRSLESISKTELDTADEGIVILEICNSTEFTLLKTGKFLQLVMLGENVFVNALTVPKVKFFCNFGLPERHECVQESCMTGEVIE